MRSAEIRQRFLTYFENRGHKIVPSSSLVPDDPSLLLTTAGMVQFKPIFQGEAKVDYSRAASCQKCVRTTDIDEVGHTARHLTFFEMLGNFSFGDYYKREAASWAWELLTEDLKMDAERFWITIYVDDDEAFQVWTEDVGIAEDRIVRLGESDNFWSAGPTGPCGPCSELLYDLGEERGCGKDTCAPGCDCDRFLEVWNLVFMQYERDEAGKLSPLPKKNIDTGMGLERAASILQGTETNFETDLILPVLRKGAVLAKIKYEPASKESVPLKIIADHARAVCFLISDGVLPSNEGRGYVLRRLIRRAVRFGRLLGIEKIFLSEIVAEVVHLMSDTYPEIDENKDFIYKVCESEEERFSHTLKSGLHVLADIISDAKKKELTEIGGEAVFQLYDTYGFPPELTKEISSEEGLEIDSAQFDQMMEEQRTKARAAWNSKVASADSQAAEAYTEVYDRFGESDFVGYEFDSVRTDLQAIIKQGVVAPRAEKGDLVEVVLAKTPFYAEMGGQVGDKGSIRGTNGIVEIEDTFSPLPQMIVHRGLVSKGIIQSDEQVEATIDIQHRKLVSRNHSATHLLQWALRQVLGEHIRQSGSYVDAKRFRFDFTHISALNTDELKRIEHLVNRKIFQGNAVKCYITSLDFAKESGAIALFGEKYSDFVRVVEMGNFSRELCGGTHVGNTSELGLFKLLSEGSVGANLRRIEAVTSVEALNLVYEEEEKLNQVAALLKVDTEDVLDRANNVLSQLKSLEKEIDSLKWRFMGDELSKLESSARTLDGFKVILEKVEADSLEDLRRYADLIRDKMDNVIIVLAASHGNKAFLVSAGSKQAVKQGFHAGQLLKEISSLVDGGGGGRPELAQAGGKDPDKIPKALERSWYSIKKMVHS